MKRKLLALTILLSISLCACGNSSISTDSSEYSESISTQQTDLNLEENEMSQPAEATTPSSAEDVKKFASGINDETADTNPSDTNSTSASDSTQEETQTVYELNDEIEEFCPSSMTQPRRDITYGEYTHGTYYSTTCGMERGYNILLPADYDSSKQYSVLYLLHGIFGNEYSFSGDNSSKIRQIVGNMTADAGLRDLLIVCPNMYATSDPNQQPAFTNEACLPYDNFINDLVCDLMPHIESEYNTLTGRENTFLAGFSMGGRESIYITLQKPELFGFVCAISAAPGVVPAEDHFMKHDGSMPEEEVVIPTDAIQPEKFIICCGTNDSVVGKFPLSYHELMEKNEVAHIWYEIPGADHNNTAIHSGIYNLLKQIAYADQQS